jgi:predicted dehydrogenase
VSGFPLGRRDFLRRSSITAAAAALGFPQILLARNPGEKLNLAVIGAGGKGASDTDHCATENIVALCDADARMATGSLRKYERAKFYQDFRQMLEREDRSLDGVVVSTPDHLHAPAAAMAMAMGKHVYCQNPLTHSVHEARLLAKLARDQRVVTQMGNQGSAEDGLRRAVEVIQAGLIGPVKEVHVWSNRPIWPQGLDRPTGSDPVPTSLNWDLWLGPAPERAFKQGVYHPFNWRGWVDFGTGALGDIAGHTANLPFRALKLGCPREIEAKHSGVNPQTYPRSSRIRFEFPARPGMPPVTFWWYDGGWKPKPELTREIEEMAGNVPGSGCLLVGEKGRLFSPDHYGSQFYVRLEGERDFKSGTAHPAAVQMPEVMPRNAFKGDSDFRHHQEWIAAIKGGPPPYSNFEVAAPLTEFILLGCVALRTGTKLEWDGLKMRAKNTREADEFVRRPYRKGWKL